MNRLRLWDEHPAAVVDLHEDLRSVIRAVVVGIGDGKDSLRANHAAALFQRIAERGPKGGCSRLACLQSGGYRLVKEKEGVPQRCAEQGTRSRTEFGFIPRSELHTGLLDGIGVRQ